MQGSSYSLNSIATVLGGWRDRRFRRAGQRFLALAPKIWPDLAAERKSGESREGKPEAASTEPRRSRPEEAELAPETEEDEPRPPRPPRPPDRHADHHSQPNRNCAEQNVDECFGYRRPPQKLNKIEEGLLHLRLQTWRRNERRKQGRDFLFSLLLFRENVDYMDSPRRRSKPVKEWRKERLERELVSLPEGKLEEENWRRYFDGKMTWQKLPSWGRLLRAWK